MYIKKDNQIIKANVVGDKLNITLQINGVFVSNPTLEQVLADGWEEYTPPEPEPYTPTFEEVYKQRIVELVRERYDIDDELAIQRKRNSDPEEFEEYNNFVEECKAKAHIYAEEMTQK